MKIPHLKTGWRVTLAARFPFNLIAAMAFAVAAFTPATAADYTWQEDQAAVLPHGDLQWAPRPFVYEAGTVVRYIDYENGGDTGDGASTAAAWKHHPWDPNATGNAALHSGVTTYVFKGGVIYRGTLDVKESGLPGDPIRLTRDPSWVAANPAMGTDMPILVGSDELPDNWVLANTLDAATLNDRIPEPDKVWAMDINSLVTFNAAGEGIEYDVVNSNFDKTMASGKVDKVTGINPEASTGNSFVGLFRRNADDTVDTVFVAQSPNRQPGDDNFQLDYWHAWDGKKSFTDSETGQEVSGVYDAWLVGHPDDWFAGGNIWPQYPWAMGTPITKSIPLENTRGGVTTKYYHSAEGVFRQGAQGGLKANVRYKIDNLPQFLDVAGEHYLDLATGILYYRPESGQDPNTMDFELITRWGTIDIGDFNQGRSNIEISGLQFSFVHGSAVRIGSNSDNEVYDNITVKNCVFRDIGKLAVTASQGELKRNQFMDNIRITDNLFENVWEGAISVADGFGYNGDFGELGHVEILRNKVFNSGIQHSDNTQSSVEAIFLGNPRTAVVAGNIVERSFGSGIMVFGGREGTSARNDTIKDIPLTRHLIFQNKTEDTATGNNDYGGMSLWQSGSIYAYNNIVGNSPGHMPGGWFGNDPMNLSYPLYLDGAFKIYSFNNVIWGRTTDPADPYRNMNQAYFMVFGFLNEFVNNTVYNFGEAMGGSSGARQNIQGNLMAGISGQFFRHAHGSLPSQIGGGDTNDTAGVASLAYENNIFHGEGNAGDVASVGKGADKDILADDFPTMQQQMEDYPIRLYGLGVKEAELPIASGAQGPIDNLTTSNVDFRPNGASAAIDGGGTPFIPWGIYGVVGEWQFNKNLRDPQQVVDYAWYMSNAHVNRNMYHYITTSKLEVNNAAVSDYVASESEDWVEGALVFNGSRHASISDAALKADMKININNYTNNWTNDNKYKVITTMRDNPDILWNVPEPSGGYDGDGDPVFGADQVASFPGLERKTAHITTQNVLVEAIAKVDNGTSGSIAGKYDGSSGYRLYVNASGKAVFEISSGNATDQVVSATSVNTGAWVHILAEADRKASGNTLTLYIDGQQDSQATGSITNADSLGNNADFIVGADNALGNHLHGAMDFLRVAHGTLAQAKTTIEELYAWQSDGPARYDLAGNAPEGQRDVGAFEATNPFSASGLQGTVSVSTGDIILSWQDNSTGEGGIIVQRATSSDMSENLTEWTVPGTDLTTWTDDTAASGVTYYYRVFVTLGADISPSSTIIKIAPGTQAPDLPTKIGFDVDQANNQILVEWDILDIFNVEKLPASWTVRWTTTPGSGYSSATGLTESNYAITGIDPLQTYHVTIEATNGTASSETQEFSVREVEENFAGLAVGEFPGGWSIEGAINASVTDSAPLASPSGTPILGVGGKWDHGFIRFDGGHDMQYYRVDAVISAGQYLLVYRADGVGQHDAFSMGESKSQIVFNGSRRMDLIPDVGETVGSDTAIDGGQEFWTLSVMTGPANNGDPASMNVYFRVLDETGANRIDMTDSLIDEVIGDWVVIYDDPKPSGVLRETFALYCKWAGSSGTYIDSLNILPFVYPGVTFSSPPAPDPVMLNFDTIPSGSTTNPLIYTVDIAGESIDVILTANGFSEWYLSDRNGGLVLGFADASGSWIYWIDDKSGSTAESVTITFEQNGSAVAVDLGASGLSAYLHSGGELIVNSTGSSGLTSGTDHSFLQDATGVSGITFEAGASTVAALRSLEIAAVSGGGATVIANDDSDSVNEGGSKAVAVLDNDSNATQIDGFTQGASGSVTQSGTDLIYAPNTGVWSGSDSFSYTAGDGSTSDTATVTMTINTTEGNVDPIGGADFDQLLAFRNAGGDIRERSDGSYEIVAMGGDGISTDTSGDQLLFIKKDVTGDFTVRVRVKSIDGPAGSFAGVMLRDGNDTDGTNDTLEKMAFEASEKGTLYLSQERTSAGSGAAVAVTSQIGGTDVSHSEPEKWVMIERVGDTISYFTGEDDGAGSIVYAEIDTSTVSLTGLGDTVQVGLFTISGDGIGNATAVFDNYTVTSIASPGTTLAFDTIPGSATANPLTYTVDVGGASLDVVVTANDFGQWYLSNRNGSDVLGFADAGGTWKYWIDDKSGSTAESVTIAFEQNGSPVDVDLGASGLSVYLHSGDELIVNSTGSSGLASGGDHSFLQDATAVSSITLEAGASAVAALRSLEIAAIR